MAFETPDPREAAFQTVLDATTDQMLGVLRNAGSQSAVIHLTDLALATRMIELGLIFAYKGPDKYGMEDLGALVLERKG